MYLCSSTEITVLKYTSRLLPPHSYSHSYSLLSHFTWLTVAPLQPHGHGHATAAGLEPRHSRRATACYSHATATQAHGY